MILFLWMPLLCFIMYFSFVGYLAQAAKLQVMAPPPHHNLNVRVGFFFFPELKCKIVAGIVASVEAGLCYLSQPEQLQVNSCSHSDIIQLCCFQRAFSSIQCMSE